MRVLVTGGAGFVAAHLQRELRVAGCEVFMTDCRKASWIADLTQPAEVGRMFEEIRPDACVHLGAISFVPDAARDSESLRRVNVGGTANVVAAMRQVVPHARLLFVSSAQVSGDRRSAYAESKLEAEKLVMKAVAEGFDAVVARPANHTGPGQPAKFVVPSFVRQAFEIKAGRQTGFVVGNLDSVRDFTDVRDVARAYRMLLEKGERGCCYAIGSNQRLTMRELLARIREIVGVEGASVEVDENLWRPTDASPMLDISAMAVLGWKAEIPLNRTLSDMCAFSQEVNR